MRKAPGNEAAGSGRWRVKAIIGVAALAVLLLIGMGGYSFVGRNVRQAELKLEQERTASEAEANRRVTEAERQRLAAVRAEQERQRAKGASEAEAGRKAAEAAEQERRARAAAEAEAKPKAVPLPQFPWPPPTASAFYVLPDNWLESLHRLGEVVGAIVSALERNGYVERSFFSIEGGGVALVTRLERIGGDGSSFVEPQRWPRDAPNYTNTDLIRFLRGLFFVDPGRYRVIVFVLRDLPFSQSSQITTGDEARKWLHSGANTLPPEAAKAPFRGQCTVLIYEFASDGKAVRVVESSLTGKQHLTKAGLLSLLEKD